MRGSLQTLPFPADITSHMEQCRGYDPSLGHSMGQLSHILKTYGTISLSLTKTPNGMGACVSLTLEIPLHATPHQREDKNKDTNGYSVRFRCGFGNIEMSENGLGSGDRDTFYITQEPGRRFEHISRCLGLWDDKHMLMLLVAHLPDLLPAPIGQHVRNYVIDHGNGHASRVPSFLYEALTQHCTCHVNHEKHDQQPDTKKACIQDIRQT